ncbi:hypothetical protein Q31b_20790 [Novipirellula aureliae]|uniref:Uncharacterized protein n=1 Tax=Novipirellula aureliae TaxID=2527966 RepID=A0A5C6E3E6_9BACT|nr:hypothetical protein [Novipirellula aureliae]TWU43044.1 hypothetical protein Q31b_20790 [Novipirellula aureliae]
MRFAKYWTVAKNSSGTVTAKGWSDASQDDAAKKASDRLQRILNWLHNPQRDLDRYQYVVDDMICEQVIDRIESRDGNEIAVVSRNAYGSLILNITCVMIVDIDVESTIKRPGMIARLFGAKATSVDSVKARKLEQIRQWQNDHVDYSFRVYRTAAGLRAIVTNRVFESIDASTLQIMAELDSDPLYRNLCKSQKCFRARLTPKPWRIGCRSPREKFPFASKQSEQAFDKWYETYCQRTKNWSVCEFLESIGSRSIHPIAEQIIDLHDGFCCAKELKLA